MLLPAERKGAYFLLFLALIMAILDTVGIASIAPFMAVLSNPDIVIENIYLSKLYNLLGHKRIGDNLLEVDDFLFSLGVLVFITLVFSISFKAWTLYKYERFTQQCNIALSQQLISGYLRQPYSWFLKKHSTDIGKAILFEVDAVITGILFPLILIFAHIAVTISIMLLLISVDPMLSILVGIGLGGIYLITFLSLRKYMTNIGEDRILANKERFKIIQEGFQGIKNIKVFGLENILTKRFYNPALRYAKHTATQHMIGKMPRFLMEILSFGGILLVILYLMKNYDGFSEIIPILALYTLAAYRLMPSFQQIYSQLSTLRYSGPALDVLFDDFKMLNRTSNEQYNFKNLEPLGISKNINLRNIDFQYEDQELMAINGMSLNIFAKSSVGIVGGTGSGKTTAADIILGLLSPDGGDILVDNNLIDQSNLRAWQRTIGYVPQQIFLTDDTIAMNIAFGQEPKDIDLNIIKNVAKIANLHDFIINKLPDGYETKIGEQGVRLSGGQRQRIGIARALYHNPEVLIFDEATSALDNATESAVMESVDNLGDEKTIIIIAHRLSTVRNCDNIFVFEDGRLVGEGTYEKLLKVNPQFQKMVKIKN